MGEHKYSFMRTTFHRDEDSEWCLYSVAGGDFDYRSAAFKRLRELGFAEDLANFFLDLEWEMAAGRSPP